MKAPSMHIIGGRRRGRPALSESGSAPVCFKLPAEDYARLQQKSVRDRTSVSDIIREAVKHVIASERGGTVRF